MAEDVKQLTYEELKAQLEAVKEQLKEKREENRFYCRIGQTGAVSFYGLGKFPVSLHPRQWDNLIANIGIVTTFMEENADKLTWEKPPKEKAEKYTEEQKAADWALMHSTPTTPEGVQQKEFATTRFNSMLAKRFSK